MQLEFGDIFTGFALRPWKPERQRLIDDLAIKPTDTHKCGLAFFRDSARQCFERISGTRPRNTYDSNGSRRPSGR
jgi:hypothetical protein